MTTIYKCDTCGREFKNLKECKMCEASHMTPIDKIKYMILLNNRKMVCDYCDKSYYVYGCEVDCDCKECGYANMYKDFIPTKPLHDKSISGV